MMQIVVCAIIHHITQQETSKDARSGRRSSEELDYIPALDAQRRRAPLKITQHGRIKDKVTYFLSQP
jgi:hypothetical protein